ncbi:hypothetical protein [Actinocrispum sp. NPDC049592]|uniref:hypothetical protein n=1 Tax=Actinocrispum sp. NPDC049592 TaxID=3154835 RepID=UPI0034225E47
MTTSDTWARLRQVIVATNEIDADTKALRSAFRLGEGFHDPELAEVAMADHTFTLPDLSYLQLVTSLDPTDALGRWTARIGGRGGYALSIQHPDPAGVKARAQELGVRVIFDREVLGHPIVQLHPKDTVILLEADGIADPDVWFWDGMGEQSQPSPDASVDAVVAVQVPVADPRRMGELWHTLLGLTPGADPAVVDMGGPRLRFVTGEDSHHWTITLRRAEDAGELRPDVIPGITFEFVDA